MTEIVPRAGLWTDILPLPVVVDADVLSRSLDHAVRHGYEPAVVRHASPSYSTFTGITVFATREVVAETYRRFDEIAIARRIPVAHVERVWDEAFCPRIRVVNMSRVDAPSDGRVDDVARRDSDDAPTAKLAVLLAPCVLLTDNWDHFQAFGEKAPHPTRSIDTTTGYALDVRDLGEFLGMLNAGMIPPRLAGVAVFEGGKALVRWVGRDVALAVAVMLLGGIVLYSRTDRGRQTRERLVEAAKELAAEHGPAVGAAFEIGVQTAERLSAFAVAPGAETLTALVARELACRGVMTTAAIADNLLWRGCRVGPASTHRRDVRAALVAQSCFWEPNRGSWTLGYHLAPRGELA